MPFTLADRVEYMDDDSKGVTSVIFKEMAGGYNNLLKVAPIVTVDELQGSIITIEDEGPQSAINSRPLYGAYNEGTPSYRNRGWKVGNYGSRASIDWALLKQRGGDKLMNDAMTRKAVGINRKVNADFYAGDSATNPNGMDGLKKLIPSTNVIKITDVDTTFTNGCNVTNANSTNLAQAQRAMLEAIDLGLRHVGGAAHPDVYILCNDDIQRLVTKAVKELGWFGTVNTYYDKQVTDFAGYKFLVAGAKNPVKTYYDAIRDANAIIPNNLAFGSSVITTELCFVRFGEEDGLHLRQFSDIKTEDLGRIPAAPVYVKEISWYLGAYAANDSCLARLTGIQAVAAARP